MVPEAPVNPHGLLSEKDMYITTIDSLKLAISSMNPLGYICSLFD